MKIAFAQWSYDKNFERTKKCIERVSPYVDVTIINFNTPIAAEHLTWFVDNKDKYNLHVIYTEFGDNFPDERNKYLELAKGLGVTWLCVSDPDELYSEELAKNLRSLIEQFDSKDYQILGVPCRDQFNAVEWLDRLDLLKEVPSGYKMTDYWKPLLIYKIFDDIRYEGVGVEKNVHETIVSKYRRRTINLPVQYFYVHEKSSLEIWRNASRNMFLSGGGDNVGSKNRLWVELRGLCNGVGVNNWEQFEQLVEKGGLTNDANWRAWLEAALRAVPTKEGTETRECAKWYFALHQSEVDDKIKGLIEKIPEVDAGTELENFVSNVYYQVLGRHPDSAGLEHYVKMIMEEKIRRVDLAGVFKNSDEYKEKFGKISSTGEYIDTDIPDKYDKKKWEKIEKLVYRTYINVLGREPDAPGLYQYTKAVMDRTLRVVDLADIFVRSEEYVEKYGTPFMTNIINKERMILKNTNIGRSVSKPANKFEKTIKSNIDSVALCIMGRHDELKYFIQSIELMKSVVDEIHVQSDDLTEEDKKEILLIDSKVQFHYEKWVDDFSDYKNKAISYANTQWVLICDADELPTRELADELKKIIAESHQGNDYDMVSLDVIDILSLDGLVVSHHRNKGGKALLHWNIPNPYYGNPHIWLRQNYYPWKVVHRNVAYNHVKEQGTDLERSVRNIFMGGGGDNSKEKNQNWIKLRDVCKTLGVDDYKAFDNYLKKGNIDKRVIEVIIALSEMPWKDEELKDILKYYIMLHPEEQIYRQKKFGDGISWENHVDEILSDKQVYYPYNAEWDRIVYLKKYKPEGGKLLDAGCNVGRYINMLSDYDYTGIDQSQYAIDMAKKHIQGAKFECMFLWDIKYTDEFDVVFMKAVMQHNQLEEKKKIIPQLYKALKKGGIFLMDESTVLTETKTQLTHRGWIRLVESYGFKFKESFHKNEIGIEDCYIFVKE